MYPPELIDLGDFSLRRSRLDDGDRVAASVRDNLEHLQGFMDWANEESGSVRFQRTRAAKVVQNWEDRVSFEFLAIGPGDVHLGTFGLERRIGPDAIELGYWLTGDAEGHGYATRAARALTEAAIALDDVDRVEIHCDEANARSAAVPARLGYRMAGVTDRPRAARSDTGRMMTWVFLRETLA